MEKKAYNLVVSMREVADMAHRGIRANDSVVKCAYSASGSAFFGFMCSVLYSALHFFSVRKCLREIRV